MLPLICLFAGIVFSLPAIKSQELIRFDEADTHLGEELVLKKLNDEADKVRITHEDLHYFDFTGDYGQKAIIADFLTKHMNSPQPIDPDNVFVLNGAASVLNSIAKNLFHPGDVVLVPTPVFPGIPKYVMNNTGIDVQAVPLKAREYRLTAGEVEQRILALRSFGKRVKGLILTNPNNPLGDVYSRETILDLMQLCKRYDMHFISDEVFSMSVYDESVKFESVLSIVEIPDPEKTHVVWGLSKALGLAGFRIGILVTYHRELQNRLRRDAQFTAVPRLMTKLALTILNDYDWVQDVYIPRSLQMLRTAATLTRKALEPFDVHVKPASAGFFLWADFGEIMLQRNTTCEMCMFNKFKEYGVLLNKGSTFFSNYGWFRITIVSEPEVLIEGLNRLVAALTYIKQAREKITQAQGHQMPSGCTAMLMPPHSSMNNEAQYNEHPMFQPSGDIGSGSNAMKPVYQPDGSHFNPFPQFLQTNNIQSNFQPQVFYPNPPESSSETQNSVGNPMATGNQGFFSFANKPFSVGSWVLSRALNLLFSTNWNPSAKDR